ncbi:MAG: 2,3-bisphosphoglycerate-independent phosphoglycerate mutase [Christensenellales bacterium]|nr:2,3-bisphosphoglycerate-independent phosphoglycerate mutase [Christensenellales bacterium]
MKYVLVIGDGIADEPLEQLGGRTPLAAEHCPAMDVLAGGRLGLCQTVPAGVAAGSDTAILSIFGYDPRTCYTGRSALEAAGMGVMLRPGETSLRVNLCALEGEHFDMARILSHNGDGVEGEEAVTLMEDLCADPRFAALAEGIGFRIHVTPTFRHTGVIDAAHEPDRAAMRFTEPHNILGSPIAGHLPAGALGEELTALMRVSFEILRDHPINRARRAAGKLAANCIWPWGPGAAMRLTPFETLYHKKGCAVSAVPLVWGIANLCGVDAPRVPGATAELDTNYEGKVDAVIAALEGGADFCCIHVEAPDECAHGGDVAGKCEAIRRLDARVVAPLLARLPQVDRDFRVLLLSDHPTLLSTRGHDGHAVPFALYDSRCPGVPRKFDEAHARETGDFLAEGPMLLRALFA